MTRTLGEQKSDARRRLRAALAAVDDPVSRSALIVARLLAWPPFRTARSVMAFMPLPGEADITAAAEDALARGARLFLPRADWGAPALVAGEVRDLRGGLVVGRAGLREPPEGSPTIPPGEIEIILVPGLGFDARGGRIGRGAGFYDRFLALAAGGGPVAHRACGVGFDAQVAEEIPMGPMDIRVGAVATESRLILTGPG